MTRLEAARERHVLCHGDADGDWEHCRQHEEGDRWPCDAAYLLGLVDELAEALRTAPMVIDATEQTAAWETMRWKAMRRLEET